ncbi:hypothetical protein HDU87_007106 [Geranomyces variabilis]|uniref:Response regulatory domain-containing protein n=1 Tax=Geranomyces variabilis TaxID=109894 RepID=A0AAD5TH25_9FUNG|nr:hypothetical protein HDU87_007106 [Geranomyces variabilis]
MAPIRTIDTEDSSKFDFLRLSRSVQLALWIGLFVGAAFLSQQVQVEGFAPVWLTTGVLTVALIRTTTPMSYLLAPTLIVAMIGIAWLNNSLSAALFSAAITFVSGSVLAVLVKRMCFGLVNGAETLRNCSLFVVIVTIISLLQGFCLALPVSTTGNQDNSSFGLTALRLFANSLLGSLLAMPFLFTIREANIKIEMRARRQKGFCGKATIFFLALATMAALPFAFIPSSSAQYDCAKFFFVVPAAIAGHTTGIPGMLTSIALGILSMTIVSVKYRPDHIDATGGTGHLDILLRLQFWSICLIAAGLLHNATLKESRAYQRALLQMQHAQPPQDSRKRASTAGGNEFSLLLGYVCKQIATPMQEVLQHCQSMIANQKGSFHEQEMAAEIAGRTINRLAQRMLPIISDAAQLANIASGEKDARRTLTDLPEFFEELSQEIRGDLANARLTTRFSLPKTAHIDKNGIRRIFRAMVICACKHGTSRSHVSIEAVTSTRFSRPVEGSEYADLDITVTVTEWVLENNQVDYLIRPYAHALPPATSSLSAGHGGVDLSIAVATVLSRSMGGRLVVYGQYGRGTIFNCKLPIRVDREGNEEWAQAVPRPKPSKTSLPKKLPPKAPLLRQLTVAASSAAEMSKTLSKKLSSAPFRSRSKDSSLSITSGKFSDHSLMSESGDPVARANEPVNPTEAQLNSGSVVSDITALRAFQEMDDKKCILVVDDSRINRLILSRMLQKYPELHVQEASDGVEAFNFCMASSYSLIFMDLHMGEMDGYECSQRLRKEGVTTPIVMTTANSERAETFTLFGISSCLIKPVTKEKLGAALLHFKVVEEGHPSLPTGSPPHPKKSIRNYDRPAASSSSAPSDAGRDHHKPVMKLPHLPTAGSYHSPPGSTPLTPQSEQVPSMKSSASESPRSSVHASAKTGSLPRSHVFSHLAPILVVDDNPVSRRILKAMLQQLVPGRDVVQASNGREAVDLCAAGQKFAIIYTDLTMPGMDGHVAASRIRSMRQIGGGPPIVAVTGHILDGESFQGLRASGINDALTKPILKEALAETLHTYGILSNSKSHLPEETDYQMGSTLSASDLASAQMVDGARAVYKQHISRTRSLSNTEIHPRSRGSTKRKKSTESQWTQSPPDGGTPNGAEGDVVSRPFLRAELLDALSSGGT